MSDAVTVWVAHVLDDTEVPDDSEFAEIAVMNPWHLEEEAAEHYAADPDWHGEETEEECYAGWTFLVRRDLARPGVYVHVGGELEWTWYSRKKSEEHEPTDEEAA